MVVFVFKHPSGHAGFQRWAEMRKNWTKVPSGSIPRKLSEVDIDIDELDEVSRSHLASSGSVPLQTLNTTPYKPFSHPMPLFQMIPILDDLGMLEP